MEQKRFINLLHRQLTDQLDQQDEVRLKDWMEDDSANEDLASRIAEAWKASESYAPDFDPSVEQGLSRLKGRIAAAKEADEKAPTLTVRSRSLFLRIAVAATLAFGLFGLWQYTSQSSGEVWQVAQTNAQKGDNKLLSDGTVVSINANTKLEFPEEFKNTERRVRLDGEAFFDVARDTEHPFIIEMEGATIKVLGTSFNIRSYGDEIELTVKSGKVAFKAEDGNKSWELIKGDQLVYKRSERTVKMQRDEQLNAIAWKRGSLVFVDTQLKEALRYMTNYYGVIFQLENAKLQNCKLNLNYEQTTVADALDILATIYQLQVRQESPKKYILSGGNCK